MEEENNGCGNIYQNTKEGERSDALNANPGSTLQKCKDDNSILDRGSRNKEDRILKRGDLARIIAW